MAENTARLSVPFHPGVGVLVNAVEGLVSKLSRQLQKDTVIDPVDECAAAVDDRGARSFRGIGKPGGLAAAWKIGLRKLQDKK